MLKFRATHTHPPLFLHRSKRLSKNLNGALFLNHTTKTTTTATKKKYFFFSIIQSLLCKHIVLN